MIGAPEHWFTIDGMSEVKCDPLSACSNAMYVLSFLGGGRFSAAVMQYPW